MMSIRLLSALMALSYALAAVTNKPTHAPTVLKTSKPSMAPSKAHPTHAPTAGQYFIMTVSQTLDGISSADFESNSNNTKVFAYTVVSSIDLSSIDYDDIDVTSVSDVSSDAHTNLRVASTNAQLTYEITYDIVTMDVETGEAGYNRLYNRLNDALGNGTFTSYLQTLAGAHGVTDMESVTSNAIDSSSYAAPADDGPVPFQTHRKKAETRYFEIGVIAGGGGFLIFSTMLITCLHFVEEWREKRNAEAKAAGGHNQGFEQVAVKEPESTAK